MSRVQERISWPLSGNVRVVEQVQGSGECRERLFCAGALTGWSPAPVWLTHRPDRLFRVSGLGTHGGPHWTTLSRQVGRKVRGRGACGSTEEQGRRTCCAAEIAV